MANVGVGDGDGVGSVHLKVHNYRGLASFLESASVEKKDFNYH